MFYGSKRRQISQNIVWVLEWCKPYEGTNDGVFTFSERGLLAWTQGDLEGLEPGMMIKITTAPWPLREQRSCRSSRGVLLLCVCALLSAYGLS